jgi:hypothetical protein
MRAAAPRSAAVISTMCDIRASTRLKISVVGHVICALGLGSRNGHRTIDCGSALGLSSTDIMSCSTLDTAARIKFDGLALVNRITFAAFGIVERFSRV